MINLLPPDVKESFYYARQNTSLLKWLAALVIAIVGVFIIILFGQVYITRATDQLVADIKQGEQSLQDQDLEATQTRVQEISDSLNLVVQVLSDQVLFSNLIQQVGAAIPEGAVLTGLTINQIDGGINLSADATDYDTATQVQVNLEDPANKIFASADLINVRCEENSGDETYPCQINIRALFGENSQFLLIPEDSSDLVDDDSTDQTEPSS